jgi:hypothetical protein
MRRPAFLVFLSVVVAIVAGCNSPAAATNAPPVPSAEASSVASSEAPSVASESPSEAAASASIAVPQFSFPSDDKELEALIPDTFCGKAAQKLSLKGQQAIGSAEEWPGILSALGKTISDVSAAAAFQLQGDTGCSVIIFRIKGADEGTLRQLAQQEAAKEGKTYTPVSIGGKDVFKTEPDKFEYAWIKGDGVIIVTADSEAQAADLISKLP